jgi:hypothetical protein
MSTPPSQQHHGAPDYNAPAPYKPGEDDSRDSLYTRVARGKKPGAGGADSPQPAQPKGNKDTSQVTKTDPEAEEEARVTKREEMLDRLAWKRFPMAAGDADRREAYKSELRKALYGIDEAAQGNSISVRIK